MISYDTLLLYLIHVTYLIKFLYYIIPYFLFFLCFYLLSSPSLFLFLITWLKLQLIFTTVQLRLLNRIATVKDDGTVEFEVPIDVEAEVLGARSNHVNNVIDDSLGATDLDYIPPLNIVMLIVGTRGDVQPFVAIGKRLQV